MMKPGLREFFAGMWQAILLRGIASLVFGLLCFFYPGITLSIIVIIFGLYLLVDGAAGVWSAFRGSPGRARPALLLQSTLSLIIGLGFLLAPQLATTYVIIVIGLWNIAVGLLQLAGSITLRREIDHALPIGLSGAVSALLGLLIVFYPAGAAISIIWIIAGAAVFVGLVLIVFAMKLRRAALDISA
jgi:uncharacterized membrane protein HdeD (DUF308 family)